MKKNKLLFVTIFILIIFLLQPNVLNKVVSVFTKQNVLEQLGIKNESEQQNKEAASALRSKLKEWDYDGGAQVIQLNQNQPIFSKEELSMAQDHWEKFSSLDFLNRVGQANALLSVQSLPSDERKSIRNVKPSGWHNKKIKFNGKSDYLYNRCHLLAFELCGQNANPQNLFTGTRSLNANFADEQNSMVYYENQVANYLRQTNHHVRVQVTPIFRGVEKVCRGVQMQAKSLEDNQIGFNIYIFNVQKGYHIDYLTGYSQKIK